ncbi:tRNA-guanine(15) transglycosylase, partial [Methanosarcinales archaeon]
HPMLFALAVALGCDIFDSAAYAIYAKTGRYITCEGTKKVQDLQFLPCSCPICSTYTLDEMKSSTDLLAEHNLWVTFEEMRTVKQSVVEGSLWELCERRCRAHPALFAALKRITRYSALIERYDPITKHPFFYLSECSAHRPEVLRYSKRLSRFRFSGNVLLTTSRYPGPEYEGMFDHLLLVKPPFGPYPIELGESYPVGQAEIPAELDEEAEMIALENVLRLLKMNTGEASFVFRCARRWARHPLIREIGKYAEVEFED